MQLTVSNDGNKVRWQNLILGLKHCWTSRQCFLQYVHNRSCIQSCTGLARALCTGVARFWARPPSRVLNCAVRPLLCLLVWGSSACFATCRPKSNVAAPDTDFNETQGYCSAGFAWGLLWCLGSADHWALRPGLTQWVATVGKVVWTPQK